MQKMLFLINPVAGKTTVGLSFVEIIDKFVKAGYDVEVRTTQSANDIGETVSAKGEEYDVIVCCGGDGTLNRTVDAIVKLEKRPVLGYIPAGTTNDFAHSHSIPVKAIDAAKTIANGKHSPIDVGVFDSRAFVYVAAFGIFSEVSYQTPQELKNVFGRLAYLVEGAKSLADISSYTMKFEHEGESIEGDFIYGMISNSSTIGGFNLPINKDSSLNDGLMEVTLVRRPDTLQEHQQLLNALISQKADNNILYHFQTKQLTVISAEPMSWSLDGEASEKLDECEIKVMKSAVEIFDEKNDSSDVAKIK